MVLGPNNFDKLELLNKHKDIINKYKLNDNYLNKLYSIYPFNKFEYVISHLLANNIISINQYYDIRNSYHARNKYLHLFEISAPRIFGETWAQNHLNELVPELQHPSSSLDPSYNGEYDFWYNGIKIEVKASRAVKRKSGEPLIIKALASNTKYGFDMNFQQIKPACCDVFVWIAVWRDIIRYWVLSRTDILNNQYYSIGQHRGNKGEGQLWLKESNIDSFTCYEVKPRDLLLKIVEKYNSLNQIKTN